jgi:anti-sigma regulatory factor (Ser/Thr protein kinase)
MKDRFELTVPASKEQIPVISELIADSMAAAGFDAKKMLEVELAAEEACANIALYAYPKGGGCIDIAIETTGDHLELTIADNGVPFDPTAKKVEISDADVEHRPIGGLGIAIIRAMVDEVSYELKDGKNVLRLIKNRNITSVRN